jgi:hypothetical protein
MSLSPFISFQSRFVTYLLKFPRKSINQSINQIPMAWGPCIDGRQVVPGNNGIMSPGLFGRRLAEQLDEALVKYSKYLTPIVDH